VFYYRGGPGSAGMVLLSLQTKEQGEKIEQSVFYRVLSTPMARKTKKKHATSLCHTKLVLAAAS
jgi:hypothetical protein